MDTTQDHYGRIVDELAVLDAAELALGARRTALHQRVLWLGSPLEVIESPLLNRLEALVGVRRAR
jgi:hypothetical protein